MAATDDDIDDGGHLYLSARGGVEYVGDSRHAWYDEAHRSMLVLSPRSRKLRQIALDTSLDAELPPLERRGSSRRSSAAAAAAVRVGQPPRAAAQNDDDDDDSDDSSDDNSDDTNGGDHDKENARHCGVTTLFDFAAESSVNSASSAERAEPVALVRLSLDKQYVAVQTSDIEVQVVRLATREKFWIVCKTSAGNRILHDGVLWNTHSSAPGSSQDLFLVTKMGIEHYRVSPKRRSCALHRALGVVIHSFWYAPTHSVLVISTGSRANEIIPYVVRGMSVEKLPRLVFSSTVSPRDLYLAPLYGQLYAVYGDTRASKLLLYLIERNRVSCVQSLELMLPPGTALAYSVVDNVLACHSLEFNVSLFFDIKCHGDVAEPFSHPLPISLRAARSRRLSSSSASSAASSSPSLVDELSTHDHDSVGVGTIDHTTQDTRTALDALPSHHLRRAHSVDAMQRRTAMLGTSTLDDADDGAPHDAAKDSQSDALRKPRGPKLERAMMTMSLGKMDHHQFDADDHYVSRWRFLAPNLVHRAFAAKSRTDLMEHVEVRKLQVNLRGVCRSCARHKDVLPFLLRRGDHALAKALALGLVRERLEEQDLTLSGAVSLFNAVQTVTHQDVVDHGAADDSPNDTSSDDESSVRSTSSSQHDLAPHVARTASFRRRLFAETRSRSDWSTQSSSSLLALGASSLSALPSRNVHGFLLLLQSEFYDHVWDKLLPDSAIAVNGRLAIYLTEFIKNLYVNSVPIEVATHVALARALLAAHEPEKLYQFLQNNMLADSIDLAELLVSSRATSRALLQAGLDMYTRLGAITLLVQTLLDCGEVDRAVAISWRNMRVNAFDASVIPAAHFFDAMVASIWSSCSASSSSPFQIAQRLRKLLLFLRVWDPKALAALDSTTASTVARTAAVSFPDSLLDPVASRQLRAAFGFPASA